MITNDAAQVHKYTEQVLEYWKKEAEKTGVYDRNNIAVAYNQSAVGLMMSRDIHGAEHNLRTAVHILSQLEDKELAWTQKLNFGYNLWLQGRLDEAEELLEDGLAHREIKFGKNDRTSSKTGAYYAALGNVELARGRVQEARRWHQHCHTDSRNHSSGVVSFQESTWCLVYRAPKVHRAEIARTTSALAQTVSDPEEKQKLESSAREALKTILGQGDLPSLPTEKHFDEATMFWSR
ncbi:hypothetical protein F4803DRAFT_554857 [Xylaria telfairii]|nr:hypothetical protein F4803DRAFT_554857 [Xylaria telfairii]